MDNLATKSSVGLIQWLQEKNLPPKVSSVIVYNIVINITGEIQISIFVVTESDMTHTNGRWQEK